MPEGSSSARGIELNWWTKCNMGYPAYGFQLYRKVSDTRAIRSWPSPATNSQTAKGQAPAPWPRSIWGVKQKVLEWESFTVYNEQAEFIDKRGIALEKGGRTWLRLNHPVPFIELQFSQKSSALTRLFGFSPPKIELDIKSKGTTWTEKIERIEEGTNWYCIEGEGIESVAIRATEKSFFTAQFASTMRSILSKRTNLLIVGLGVALVAKLGYEGFWMIPTLAGLLIAVGLGIAALAKRTKRAKGRPAVAGRRLLDRLTWMPSSQVSLSGFGYSDWQNREEDWVKVTEFPHPNQIQKLLKAEIKKNLKTGFLLDAERLETDFKAVDDRSIKNKLQEEESKKHWTYTDSQALPGNAYDYKIEGKWGDPDGLGIQAFPWERSVVYSGIKVANGLHQTELVDGINIEAGEGSYWESQKLHIRGQALIHLPFMAGRASIQLQGNWEEVAYLDQQGNWQTAKKGQVSEIHLKDLNRGICAIRVVGDCIWKQVEIHPANFSYVITDVSWPRVTPDLSQRSGIANTKGIQGKTSHFGSMHYLKLSSNYRWPRIEGEKKERESTGESLTML